MIKIKNLEKDMRLIDKIFSWLEQKEEDLALYENMLEEEKTAIDEKISEVEFQRQRIQKLI